jgi:hypothetical protein
MNFKSEIQTIKNSLNIGSRKIIRFNFEPTDIFFDPELQKNRPWTEYEEKPGDKVVWIHFEPKENKETNNA